MDFMEAIRRLPRGLPAVSRSIVADREDVHFGAEKQPMASAGVQTIGSFSLKLVFNSTGTPVIRSKASISR